MNLLKTTVTALVLALAFEAFAYQADAVQGRGAGQPGQGTGGLGSADEDQLSLCVGEHLTPQQLEACSLLRHTAEIENGMASARRMVASSNGNGNSGNGNNGNGNSGNGNNGNGNNGNGNNGNGNSSPGKSSPANSPASSSPGKSPTSSSPGSPGNSGSGNNGNGNGNNGNGNGNNGNGNGNNGNGNGNNGNGNGNNGNGNGNDGNGNGNSGNGNSSPSSPGRSTLSPGSSSPGSSGDEDSGNSNNGNGNNGNGNGKGNGNGNGNGNNGNGNGNNGNGNNDNGNGNNGNGNGNNGNGNGNGNGGNSPGNSGNGSGNNGNGVFDGVGGPKPPFQLRLAGQGRTQGGVRFGWLQASADSGATWGTVCVMHYSATEATAACRQMGLGALGLPVTAATADASFGAPAVPSGQSATLLNVQQCKGGESSLEQCARRPWGQQDCVSNNGVAGVVCLEGVDGSQVRLVGGNSTSGRVEVYLGAGLWGSVCASSDTDNDNEEEDDEASSSGSGSSSSWNNAAARVVCRQLGFEDGTARIGGFRAFNSALTKADDPAPTVMSGFKCNGNEASLMACARGEMGDVGKCGNGNGASLAGVMCWGVPPAPASPPVPETPLPSMPLPSSSPPPIYGPYTFPSSPPAYPSTPPSTPPPSPPLTPPPLGPNELPPTSTALVVATPTPNGVEVTAVNGVGLIKIRAADGNWSYVCGDPWSGWDDAAASAACRQSGYVAGGMAVRTWRQGALPALLLGRIACNGTEASLSRCPVYAVPEKGIQSWQLAAPWSDTAGLCTMLGGVKCNSGDAAAPITLRAAAQPALSGSVLSTDDPLAPIAALNGSVLVRLEAAVGGGGFGAVCRSKSFSPNVANVACRQLGYASGTVYDGPSAVQPGTPEFATQVGSVDAKGSYLGVVSELHCGGSETDITQCPGWRSGGANVVMPCRTAAWVACSGAAAAA